MKSITVAELRQNPTDALSDVETGETYVVTKHRREIARLVPADQGAAVTPPKKSGGSKLARRPRTKLTTAPSVDALLADMESAW